MPPESSQVYPKSGYLRPRRQHGTMRSLDNVPMRNSTAMGDAHGNPSHASKVNYMPQQVLYPTLPELTSPSPSSVERESYSPTSSEIDALEEISFDYEIQSNNLIDNAGTPTVASKLASSANYIQDDTASTTSSSYLSLPDTMHEFLVDAPKSLAELLHLAWRTLCPRMQSYVLDMLIKCRSSMPIGLGRCPFYRAVGANQGRCAL